MLCGLLAWTGRVELLFIVDTIEPPDSKPPRCPKGLTCCWGERGRWWLWLWDCKIRGISMGTIPGGAGGGGGGGGGGGLVVTKWLVPPDKGCAIKGVVEWLWGMAVMGALLLKPPKVCCWCCGSGCCCWEYMLLWIGLFVMVGIAATLPDKFLDEKKNNNSFEAQLLHP